MDLKARRESLIKDLQELSNRALQFQGAIAMLDELIGKEESATTSTPPTDDEKENT